MLPSFIPSDRSELNPNSMPTESSTQSQPPTRVPISSNWKNGPNSTTTNGPTHNQPSNHTHTAHQNQHASLNSSAASNATAAATSSTSVTSSTTTNSEDALPTAARSQYRTYILSNGVFEVEQRYQIRETIGAGAYGVVASALDHKRNTFVAIKKIENVFDHRSLAKRTLRELKLVRLFEHENILGLERVMRPHSSTFNNIYLVSQLMETDLACVIRSPQDLTDEHTQFFIYQVLRGLKYIHSANVIHRDLKPRNLLVNSNCDLKICDFGLARVDDPNNHDRAMMSNYIATRWYRAPEVILQRNRYTKAVDMWSVGCILAELIGRKPIFPGRDSFHQITLIVSVLGTPPPTQANDEKGTGTTRKSGTSNTTAGPTDDYISALPHKPKIPFQQLYSHASPLACDLLDKLLCFDPDQRLTVEEALRHPYLEVLHCEEDEPVCTNMDLTEFYFEYLKCSKEDLRVLIHQEIVNHYREESFDYQAAGSDGDPLDDLKGIMNHLPKGSQANAAAAARKGRRKSF